MGIRITTDEYGVRVWRSDRYGHPNYSISIQKKKDDGGYVTEYKQVKFRGGVEIENGSDIIIRDGFPTIDTWQDKNTGEQKKKEVWVILDFHYRNEAPVKREQNSQQQQSFETWDDVPDSFQVAEDDMPF